MNDILLLKQVIALLKQEHGNILHMAVYMRDIRIFNNNTSKELLKEKHNGMTPYELAGHLNYCEFLGIKDKKDNIYYEVLPVDKILDTLDKNEPLNEKIIKMVHLKKHLNPLQGYKTRLVKVSLNFLFSESKKISVIDLRESIINKEDDKIIILYHEKEYKFKGFNQEMVDEIFHLITDRKERERLLNEVIKQEKSVEVKTTMNEESYDAKNEYLLAFLIKILALEINSNELNNLLFQIKPIKNYIEIENMVQQENVVANKNENVDSDESFYSSFEEEFFDVESPSYNFKIYRATLPSKTCSSYEPLSYIQKLTEQFQNIGMINEENDPLMLFEQIILYSIASYSIFRKRVRPCFDTFIGETFSNVEKEFEFYVERTDSKSINLIYSNKFLILTMVNTDVEIKVFDYIIRYTYNIKKVENRKDEDYNVINQQVKFKMYKKRNKTNMVEKDDDTGIDISLSAQGQFPSTDENTAINRNPDKNPLLNTILITNNLNDYVLQYECILLYSNNFVSGTIQDKNTPLKVIKGNWDENITIRDLETGNEKMGWVNNIAVFGEYYFFNMYTLQLNITYNVKKCDSRKREDIRAIEDGRVDLSRESNVILKNREKLKELENRVSIGTLFKKVDNAWIFDGFKTNDFLSFEIN